MKDVIQATEGMSRLDGKNVVRFFDYTDLAVFAMRIAAVEAQFAITDVIALCADSKFILDVEQSLS